MTQDIAHELRTPLTTLKSHTRALEDGVWEPTADRFRTCLDEIDRLIQLVTELEELHDMESPEFQPPGPSRIWAILWREPSRWRRRCIMKRSEFAICQRFIDRSRGGCRPDAPDSDQCVKQCLALHPPGGKVQADLVDEGTDALIRIRDSGQGISPSDLPFIFERLYRGDKSRNRLSGGSGMGLAIVKQLVSAHGGHVWAESGDEFGGGSCFYIRIPKRINKHDKNRIRRSGFPSH